jgi:RNA polymerase-associated protein RTF1
MNSASLKLCSSSYLSSKVRDINGLLHRQWTNQEIQDKIDRQNKYKHLLKPINKAAVGPLTLQRDEALHRRNMENRRLNEQQVRAALLAERKHRKESSKRAAQKKKEDEEKKANGSFDELFGDRSRTGTPAKEVVSKYVHRDYKKGLQDFTRMKTDDEIIGAMDFGIDIDI